MLIPGDLDTIGPSQLATLESDVAAFVVSSSAGLISRVDIARVDLTSGSIVATVIFQASIATGTVGTVLANVNEAVAGGRVVFTIAGNVAVVTEQAVPMLRAGAVPIPPSGGTCGISSASDSAGNVVSPDAYTQLNTRFVFACSNFTDGGRNSHRLDQHGNVKGLSFRFLWSSPSSIAQVSVHSGFSAESNPALLPAGAPVTVTFLISGYAGPNHPRRKSLEIEVGEASAAALEELFTSLDSNPVVETGTLSEALNFLGVLSDSIGGSTQSTASSAEASGGNTNSAMLLASTATQPPGQTTANPTVEPPKPTLAPPTKTLAEAKVRAAASNCQVPAIAR